ncbi:GATOR2 complex protein WDR59-like isoform X3 [Macrobrachium nipponense]|uniref:GATOR2 complex protein WDR59-like isoform X3 n=1 Tax=Macrobrachium nipponense TaxID=159736 RepID=UPI0030C88E0A
MAVRWSSENVVAEHRDLQASAMALDCNGEYTILAGRRYLGLISLERPTEIIKRVSRTQQKYDVIACEWHPSQAERNTFVIAFGERSEVCVWDEGHLKTLHVLRAHTRTVTDLNWHRTDPHILATCSIDTFVHIWDVREARKPVTSLTSIAGATQVKWNKINQHYLASGHDCDIRVWDDRKTSQPLHYISAHLSKIHGLDWSPNHEHHLVSASNDCSVKFFDITNSRKEENYINTMSPVWRAKYTPFGEGVVTVVMPQLRRGENSLLLWSVTDVGAPAHTFVGHTDVVLEFEWRQSLSNPGDIQMVSWARDHSLRIWNIDHQLQRMCGHEAEDESMLMESTDSELASEPPIMQGESEADVEKLDSNIDSPLPVEGEAIKCVNDGCIPEQPQSIPKIMQEVSSMVTGVSCKDIDASRSTPVPSTELPQSSHQESDATVHLDPTPESTLASTPTSTQLMESLPNVSTPSKSGNISVGMSSTLPSMNHPMTLHQEFSLLNTHLDNNQGNSLEVSTDVEARSCVVTVKHGSHIIYLAINFPNNYPQQACPNFRFNFGTTLDYTTKGELMKVLKTTALQYQRKRKGCLEPIIRVFVMQLNVLLGDERQGIQLGYPNQVYGSYQDHSVPFPRTSGAKFCSAGILVCFARPTFMKKGSNRTEPSTPRSLSALGAYITNFMPQMSTTVPTSPKYNYMFPGVGHSPSGEQNISISNYYYQDTRMKSRRSKNEDENSRSFKAGSVMIYDVKSLMPFSRELGAAHVLDDSDIVQSCTKNRDAAAAVGRKDLVQVWSLAAATASLASSSAISSIEDVEFPWCHHPFARKLVDSLLSHYLKLNDVQTATMLSCVFGTKAEAQNVAYPRKNRTESNSQHLLDRLLRKTGGSPYNTIHGINTSLDGWDLCMVRHNRSNSEGSLSDAARPSQEVDLPALEATDTLNKNTSNLLDAGRSHQYNEMRRAYADILYRWGLLEQRAMVLKYLQTSPTVHKGVEFQTDCVHCGQSAKGPQCLYCRRFSFTCSICHIALKGTSNFCVVCGHGGHTYHLLDWFRDHNECPTGCGCDCIKEMDSLFR